MPLGLLVAIVCGMAFIAQVFGPPIQDLVNEIRLRRLRKQNKQQRILDTQTKEYSIEEQIKALDLLSNKIDEITYDALWVRDLPLEELCVMACLSGRIKGCITNIQNDLGPKTEYSLFNPLSHRPPSILEEVIKKSIYSPSLRQTILYHVQNPPSTSEEVRNDSWLDGLLTMFDIK